MIGDWIADWADCRKRAPDCPECADGRLYRGSRSRRGGLSTGTGQDAVAVSKYGMPLQTSFITRVTVSRCPISSAPRSDAAQRARRVSSSRTGSRHRHKAPTIATRAGTMAWYTTIADAPDLTDDQRAIKQEDFRVPPLPRTTTALRFGKSASTTRIVSSTL